MDLEDTIAFFMILGCYFEKMEFLVLWNKGGGHPEILKKGKGKIPGKKMKEELVRFELSTLHTSVLHAVMALSGTHKIKRMKDKNSIHC